MFRAGAILLGVLPFLLFEMGLYLNGWQPSSAIVDPYVGFTEIRPLFQIDATGKNYEISASRFPLFCPETFLVDKLANEYRIFCVGGSTVQGRPFAIETAFSTWLELRLQVADPSKDWNVINCGGVSYASYRLAPIMEEIMAYQPDLVVLYTGHNEFLEDRTYESVKTTPTWILRTHERLAAIKTYSFVRSMFVSNAKANSGSAPIAELPTEVEARLDFRNGLEKYHRDDQWTLDVARHFELNLRRMVATAQRANVPLLLCNPVCNLRDVPPFKSQSSSDISADDRTQFDEIWNSIKARDDAQTDLQHDLQQLNALFAIDPRHAAVQFRMGQTQQLLGKYEMAKSHLIRAKEEDICPLRIIEPMYDSIANVALASDVPLIDIKQFFERRADDGIPGRESLLDHVHPTIHGHQLISKLLLDEMVSQGWVEISGSTAEQEQRFESRLKSHLASLPFMYFEKGKDRLAGLKRWAEGRVTRQPVKE